MLFYKQSHLLDGLPNFGRLRTATQHDPLLERPLSCSDGLSTMPRRHPKLRRQLTSGRDESEAPTRPDDLSI